MYEFGNDENLNQIRKSLEITEARYHEKKSYNKKYFIKTIVKTQNRYFNLK